MALNCIFCLAVDESDSFYYVESISTSASNQPVEEFLKHHLQIFVNPSALVCFSCKERVDSLDDMLVRSVELSSSLQCDYERFNKIAGQTVDDSELKSDPGYSPEMHDDDFDIVYLSDQDVEGSEEKVIDQEEECNSFNFCCELCGMAYKSKSALNYHINSKHIAKKSFQCKICNKSFTQKGYFNIHMRIHSGETKFQCHQCGKQFIHVSSFKIHVMTHTDTREYKCSQCDKMFRSASHLSRHVKTHTGEKPFACPVCDQRFAQRYNMKMHLRGMHTKKEEVKKSLNCLICDAKFDQKQKLDHHLQSTHLTVKQSGSD